MLTAFLSHQTYTKTSYLHKSYVLTSDYYQKSPDAEKNYIKTVLLENKENCLDNIMCQSEFNYYITLDELDQLISKINKRREQESAYKNGKLRDNTLNKEFLEIIQK